MPELGFHLGGIAHGIRDFPAKEFAIPLSKPVNRHLKRSLGGFHFASERGIRRIGLTAKENLQPPRNAPCGRVARTRPAICPRPGRAPKAPNVFRKSTRASHRVRARVDNALHLTKTQATRPLRRRVFPRAGG